MKLFSRLTLSSLVLVVMSHFVMAERADAVSVSYDEIIFQAGGTLDPTRLSGTVDMSFSGSTLTIILTNTSLNAGGSLSQNLLTGLGFNLPRGLTINTSATNTVISLTDTVAPPPNDFVSPSGSINDTRWGYTTSGPLAGFKTVANGGLVTGGRVNVDIGTVQSMIDRDFNNQLKPLAAVQGPNYGILSSSSGYAGCTSGLPCVIDSLTFNIQLSGSYSGDLVSWIDNHYMVLAFGSPAPAVPEPTSLLLLGSGLLALGLYRRLLG